MYGGRAIDNFDRRVLNTYMNEYMGDFIFDAFQPFRFFENDEITYLIPTLKDENKDMMTEAMLGNKKSIFNLSYRICLSLFEIKNIFIYTNLEIIRRKLLFL